MIVLPVWVAVLVAFWLFAQSREGGAVGLIEGWLAALSTSRWALLGLFAAYAVRPLLLLPMTVLTTFTGFLLGPLWGASFALAAVLASASIAYFLARYLGAGRTPRGDLWRRLRDRGFEAVVTARLMLVPGDAVNYVCGVLRIPYPSFAAATAVGGLPGLMIGILAGSSVDGAFSARGLRLNVWYLVASAALLVASLATARLLRRRQNA